MAELAPIKYRAFLSYAHADLSWGKWLHGWLENYRLDRDLHGKDTAGGPVPKSLRPIFRDREDFSGGHTLTEATIAALDASAALIVLCSTVSATRPAVNEEVRLFRSRHPDRPVIPVIIEATYPDNFPPTLRFALGSDGVVTDQPLTILGPDLREEGNGRELGLAKIVAGLTGLATDDIVRRAERARRQALRNWVAGLSVVALALAGLAVWAEVNRREAVKQQALAEEQTQIAETRRKEADEQRKLAEQRRQEAERNFAVAKQGADALVFDIAQALRDQQGMRTETVRKFLGTAEQVFDKLVASAGDNSELLRSQEAMLSEFATTYAAQGDTTKQEEAARKSLAIAERLATSDPGNAESQRDLSVSYERIGSELVSQGNLTEALKSYQDSLAIAERLATSDPGNAEWQRDLSVSYERIGSVLVSQGNLPEALKSYQASLVIAERLAQSDPGKTEWQRDLIVSYAKLAGVFAGKGWWRKAHEIVLKLRSEGRLAPADAWMVEDTATNAAADGG